MKTIILIISAFSFVALGNPIEMNGLYKKYLGSDNCPDMIEFTSDPNFKTVILGRYYKDRLVEMEFTNSEKKSRKKLEITKVDIAEISYERYSRKLFKKNLEYSLQAAVIFTPLEENLPIRLTETKVKKNGDTFEVQCTYEK